MLISFPSTRGKGDPIWVNAHQVTHIEQYGEGSKTKIFFVGGTSVEVAEPLSSVVNQINANVRSG